MAYDDNGFTLGTLVKWTLLGFIALFALKLVLGLLGSVFGFAMAVVFTLGPIVLLGWLTLKAIEWLRGAEREAL